MVIDRATDLQGLPAGQGNLFPAPGVFARAMAAGLGTLLIATADNRLIPVVMVGFLMISLTLLTFPRFSRPLPAVAALLAAALLMACTHTVPKAVAYASGDHAAFRATGTATIAGEGFLRRPNGRLVRCSGNEVFLLPDTPYFREWLAVHRAGKRFDSAADLAHAHRESVRVTQCDMAGTFRFGQLPAGKWFVATRVSYRLDRVDFTRIDLINDYWRDDAMFVTAIETRNGEVSRPVLSNPNRM